jgi:hypothetical protein
VALLPISLIILTLRLSRGLPGLIAGNTSPAGTLLLKQGLKGMAAACLVAAVAIAVVNAGNLFQGVFVPLADFHLRSQTLSTLVARFPWLGHLPVPTSFAWFQGLDWVLHDSKAGAATANLYLFGELRDPTRGESFPGYYFLVSLFKVPIAAQLILLLAMGRLLWQRRQHQWLDNEIFLLVPLLYFFYFSTFPCPGGAAIFW